MKFLITLCMCMGVSVAQQLPNYYQGSYNVPNAPIPAPGSWQSGPPAAAPAAYQPQPAAYSAAPRPQWSAPASPAQYSAASPAYSGYAQPAQAAAPVSHAPSSYGWNVQHSSPAPQPQQAQPALIPTAAAPAAPQYQQYAAPQPQQYSQPRAAPAVAPASYPAPTQAYQAPQTPISAALRPASVHYASVGENLNGDYKFGYRTGNGDSFREETRAPDGTVQGQYGFVDADGKERIVKYSAGVNGFQVLNGDGASPAPAAVAAAPAPQWGQPQARAAPQVWGAPQGAAPQQQWG